MTVRRVDVEEMYRNWEGQSIKYEQIDDAADGTHALVEWDTWRSVVFLLGEEAVCTCTEEYNCDNCILIASLDSPDDV